MSELYELPNGWEWKGWGDIVIIKNGKDYKTVLNENGKYPIYGSGGIMNYSDKYLCNENSVVIGRKGTINNPLFVKEKFWNIDTAFGLEAKQEILEPLFLYYFCLSYNFLQLNTSTTLPSLTKSNLQTIEMPFPPLSEQQRLVKKIDSLFEKIDKSIELHQKNMDEANAFMGSVLNEVFYRHSVLDTESKNDQWIPNQVRDDEKWEKSVSLKDITTKIGSGATPSGGQKAYKTEGISLIRSMNVHDYGFRFKNLAFIDDTQAKKLNNVIVNPNDVLLNITGASVARCCIVDESSLPARVNQHVSIIRLKDDMLPKFLHYYLISPSIKSNLLFSSSGGATREAITKSMIENFTVPLPPVLIQQKVVEYLDTISAKMEKVKSIQKEKMASLKALKASILDKAFRGEL